MTSVVLVWLGTTFKNAAFFNVQSCNEYKCKFGRLNRGMDEGVRYYQVDDQVLYPSVTSVISFISRQKFG